MVLADDERSAVATAKDGGDREEEGNKVVVAEEKKDKRAEDGYSVREKLTTAEAGEGDHGEDITHIKPQQSGGLVDVDETISHHHQNDRKSSWKVWRWFSSSSPASSSRD
jgi:hypothetical protein